MHKTLTLFTFLLMMNLVAPGEVIWHIGNNDQSSADLALGPSGYKDFLAHDFGYEDRWYLIGHSDPKTDFPYVLPGPADGWGGTGGTSGWRTHEINILFGVHDLPADRPFKLIVDLMDTHPLKSVVKIIINHQHEKFVLSGGTEASLSGPAPGSKEHLLEIDIDKGVIKKGATALPLPS
jgi:hypothetical protein